MGGDDTSPEKQKQGTTEKYAHVAAKALGCARGLAVAPLEAGCRAVRRVLSLPPLPSRSRV